MKAKLSLVVLGLFCIGIVSSCKKPSNISGTQRGDKQNRHGYGALLDSVAFSKVPRINLDEVKANLISMGLLSKQRLDGTPPVSMILNYPSPGDQGADGTCASWSAGYSLMGTLNNEYPTSGVSNPRSPFYIYQKDHSASGNCSTTDGMYLTSAMNILQNNGVPDYSVDSSLGSVCTVPSPSVNSSAAANPVFRYGAVTSVAQVKQAISLHLPVEIGFRVSTSFENAWAYGTTFSSVSGVQSTGHAMAIIGYDDTKNAVLVENSWGIYGGDATYAGCMWFDYSILTNSSLGIEMYVATPLSSSKQPVFEFYSTTLYKHTNSLNISIPAQFPSGHWVYNGQPFSAYAVNVAGTIPIYQFTSTTTDDHVLTTNSNPSWAGSIYQNNGAVFYGYANNTTTPGTIPIYEYYYNNDHYYSTSSTAPSGGWVYLSQPFRMLPN
ncbi:C1 family peptidase [Mucilaginibacter ximonensis]|uniref:C1 family peptidase n=1 Tax=Mucilaginibacter ximonensis TaxID=538021 RepID=A0ABW5YAN8_9SPHI